MKSFVIGLLGFLAVTTVPTLSQQTHYLIVNVFGLNGGASFVLQDNNANPITISKNGIIVIANGVQGTPYFLAVRSAPPGTVCTIKAPNGFILGTDVTIPVTCAWTPLANAPPQQIGTMLLLSNGTVMAEATGYPFGTAWGTWWGLKPDNSGSYVNGTWKQLASSICLHDEFASQVLEDGRVFVAGGEYGSQGTVPNCAGSGGMKNPAGNAGTDAEIYDPVQNSWTSIDPPRSLLDPTQISKQCQGYQVYQAFSDAVSETLPDGSVLIAPLCPKNEGDTLIYNPKADPADAWSFGGTLANGAGDQAEASWVKLPDGSVLSIDPPFGGTSATSERYIPPANGRAGYWFSDAVVAQSTFDPWGTEEGPAFLLPNGTAIFIGGAPVSALYTPGTPGSAPAQGAWAQGCIPNCFQTVWGNGWRGTLGAPDAPGTMMPNGKLFLALSDAPSSGNLVKKAPTYFYEYDYSDGPLGTFSQVPGPGSPSEQDAWSDCGTTDGHKSLLLPNGTVLFVSACGATQRLFAVGTYKQLFVYRPVGGQGPQGKPVVTQIIDTKHGWYSLSGTGLNGISEGSAFGDDAQNASNYPLVRLTNSNGDVFYARTYNWNSTGVMTGTAIISTSFVVPQIPKGCYWLQAIANGNASDPLKFCVT